MNNLSTHSPTRSRVPATGRLPASARQDLPSQGPLLPQAHVSEHLKGRGAPVQAAGSYRGLEQGGGAGYSEQTLGIRGRGESGEYATIVYQCGVQRGECAFYG